MSGNGFERVTCYFRYGNGDLYRNVTLENSVGIEDFKDGFYLDENFKIPTKEFGAIKYWIPPSAIVYIMFG
jgi:hypothetical protein